MFCENIWCIYWDEFKCLNDGKIHINDNGICETQGENCVNGLEYERRRDWVFNCKVDGLYYKYIQKYKTEN